jgi:hypothetical protein
MIKIDGIKKIVHIFDVLEFAYLSDSKKALQTLL